MVDVIAVPPRNLLAQLAGGNPRLIQYLEDSAKQSNDVSVAVNDTADANETLQTAPLLTFAPSNTFTNERILRGSSTIKITYTSTEARIDVTSVVPQISGSRPVTFLVTDVTNLILPTSGTLATTADIAGAGGVTSFNSRTGAINLLSADVTNALGFTPISGNQVITLSGDASGSGATSITVTLPTVNTNTGTFGGAATVPQFSVNGKGLVTGVTAVPIAISWSAITSGKPTTLAGYGITDAVALTNIANTFTENQTIAGITKGVTFEGTYGPGSRQGFTWASGGTAVAKLRTNFDGTEINLVMGDLFTGSGFTGDILRISPGGTDVTGEVRCDTLRIDTAPTASATASTHSVPISINGTIYYLRLSATP